ncbi:MAG: tRNA preQ1(34) S-adenosylmethionine ribosyltransferase-isomerase QueA [Pseudomonadota bacterium]
MQRDLFTYQLPEELIAQTPLSRRDDSKLLCIDGQKKSFDDGSFCDLVDLLSAKDLLVFNNTKVIPARLFGQKNSGGKVEIFAERLLSANELLAQVRASKSPKSGSKIRVGEYELRVMGRDGEFFVLASDHPIESVLDAYGHIPLPPYIHRPDTQEDSARYQTVYASVPGAVAAPTAGLHFSKTLLDTLSEKGVAQAFVTLHVGAGTFQPVRVQDLKKHRMHREQVQVDGSVVAAVEACRQRGGRVVAVGTTSVRSLETAALAGHLTEFHGESDLFLYPGASFRVVDAMITNFHLPESTLLMLVCGFAGTDLVLRAYDHAVRERYRFFSYGDACFITRPGCV